MEGRIHLLGKRFLDLVVQTTHSKMRLPEDHKGRWLCFKSLR